MANQAEKKRTKANSAFKKKFLGGLIFAQIFFVFHRGFLFAPEPFAYEFFLTWFYYLAAYSVMLGWLLSSMASQHYKDLIKSGWTAICFDSVLIMASAQVLSFATSYALFLLYLVPVLILMQSVKVCLAAKNMLGGLMGGMGGGAQERPLDEAEDTRRGRKGQTRRR